MTRYMLVLHRSRMENTDGNDVAYIWWTSVHGPRKIIEKRKQIESNRMWWKRGIQTGVRELAEEMISPMMR